MKKSILTIVLFIVSVFSFSQSLNEFETLLCYESITIKKYSYSKSDNLIYMDEPIIVSNDSIFKTHIKYHNNTLELYTENIDSLKMNDLSIRMEYDVYNKKYTYYFYQDVKEFHNLNPYYKCDKYHFYANEYVWYIITTYQPIEKKQPYGWHYSDEFIIFNYKI